MDDREGRILIDACMDKNVLVFDDKADMGTVSKALVFRMANHSPKINTILVNPRTYYDFIPIDWTVGNPIVIFGITMQIDDRLNCNPDGHFLEYYKLRSGWMNHRDNLAIGFNNQTDICRLKDDECILGVY